MHFLGCKILNAQTEKSEAVKLTSGTTSFAIYVGNYVNRKFGCRVNSNKSFIRVASFQEASLILQT